MKLLLCFCSACRDSLQTLLVLMGFRLRPVQLHQCFISFGPLEGDTGGNPFPLSATCLQEYTHPRCHPSLTLLLLQKPFSRHCLASRASAILELWLSSTTLVILAAEKQAWAMAAPNLFASQFEPASWDDKDRDLSAELCLKWFLSSWDLCGFFFLEPSSRPACLLFLGVSPLGSSLSPWFSFIFPELRGCCSQAVQLVGHIQQHLRV